MVHSYLSSLCTLARQSKKFLKLQIQVDHHKGLEPSLSDWKSDMLAIDINGGSNGGVYGNRTHLKTCLQGK